MHRILLLLVVFYSNVHTSSLNVLNYKEGAKLVGVVVCYRHGDRSPSISFPNDEYFDLKYWPDGHGQLLNKGKVNQFKLGQWLRSRYDGFLSDQYVPREILVKSSDVDRTLRSAASNLAGLYYPKNQSYINIWPEYLPWDPVPIHTAPESTDEVLAMKKPCNKYKRLLTETVHSETYTNILKDHKNITKFLKNKTGLNDSYLNLYQDLHSLFYIYKNHNESYLPDWYDEFNHDELAYLAGLSFASETSSTQMQRVKIGPFFSYLQHYFDGILNNKNKKFLMLSGHDGTIVSILNSYGSYDYYPPEYCAMVIWELYKTEDGDAYLKVFYKRYTTGDELEEITVRNCNHYCYYDEYKRLLANITVDSNTWEKECNENL